MTPRAKIDSFCGPYRFLSNFYLRDFVFQGKVWPTAEHAYQAQKTDDPEQQERIRLAPTPGRARRLGKNLQWIDRKEHWESVKLSVMMDILRAKFSTPELADRLRATGSADLIEGNNWGDRFWGVCDGIGENRLGHLLMQVRREIF